MVCTLYHRSRSRRTHSQKRPVLRTARPFPGYNQRIRDELHLVKLINNNKHWENSDYFIEFRNHFLNLFFKNEKFIVLQTCSTRKDCLYLRLFRCLEIIFWFSNPLSKMTFLVEFLYSQSRAFNTCSPVAAHFSVSILHLGQLRSSRAVRLTLVSFSPFLIKHEFILKEIMQRFQILTILIMN